MQWQPLALVSQIDHGVSTRRANPLINQRDAFGDFNIFHDEIILLMDPQGATASMSWGNLFNYINILSFFITILWDTCISIYK